MIQEIYQQRTLILFIHIIQEASMISTVDETGVTSTLAGLWRSLSVSAWISAGMVAEKSKVCFLTGSNEMIFLHHG